MPACHKAGIFVYYLSAFIKWHIFGNAKTVTLK